ncbi:hypothetical protein B0H12DRAFT_1132997 [Mycena haematopus]|nr:hypothetical protein B0H12DRAFT_1132997 [Mycena haematopus]
MEIQRLYRSFVLFLPTLSTQSHRNTYFRLTESQCQPSCPTTLQPALGKRWISASTISDKDSPRCSAV